MTLLKAPVYGLDDKLYYGKLGDVIWDGKRLYTKPLRNPKLQNILRPYELTTATGMERFDPETDPEVWIRNLYRRYLSAQLRVYRANEISPLTGKKQPWLLRMRFVDGLHSKENFQWEMKGCWNALGWRYVVKASDLFVQSLEADGIEHVFGVPGEENADFMIIASGIAGFLHSGDDLPKFP